MAGVIWTEPALADLEAIADYIALDNEEAARKLVARIFRRVEQLQEFPESGSAPKELKPMQRYRQLVEKPCRVIYRIDSSSIFIVHILRGEQRLRRSQLTR